MFKLFNKKHIYRILGTILSKERCRTYIITMSKNHSMKNNYGNYVINNHKRYLNSNKLEATMYLQKKFRINRSKENNNGINLS